MDEWLPFIETVAYPLEEWVIQGRAFAADFEAIAKKVSTDAGEIRPVETGITVHLLVRAADRLRGVADALREAAETLNNCLPEPADMSGSPADIILRSLAGPRGDAHRVFFARLYYYADLQAVQKSQDSGDDAEDVDGDPVDACRE